MEPENQREGFSSFLKEVKTLYPDKDIWCYTGYTLETDCVGGPKRAFCEVTKEMLSLLDILVDGRFVEEEYDISLRSPRSKNQRLIDLPGRPK